MAKKTHLKVRMVPESNPDSKFIYYAKKPTKGEKVKNKLKLKKGGLADIAPTVLKLLKIHLPKEMTGKSLIK